jgi:hypothetical protein
MPEKTSAVEQKRVFDLIWSQMPQMQNRTSSSWWFFILLPKGEEGYGPKQFMFSVANRVGDVVSITGTQLPGIDLKREINDGVDRFDSISVGWYCDGKEVYEDLVKRTAVATLSRKGSIQAWAEQANGEQYGSEVRASATDPLTLEAHFKGANGEARFSTWGNLDKLDTSPDEAINIDTPLGGTHFIAWRLVNFKGEFRTPTGTEQLEGLGYFQRVCLNVPTFPWKWIWALFEDGTLFSSYVPYIGPNLFRRGYKFFNKEWIEQRTISVAPAAYIDFHGATERLDFDTAKITPILGNGPHPDFGVHAKFKNGDFIRFRAECYGHAGQYIDRSVLNGRASTHWTYNEYMFRMRELSGRIGEKLINKKTMGNGFGSLEYTWGLGL